MIFGLALFIYLFICFVSVFIFNDLMKDSVFTLPKPWLILYLDKLSTVISGKSML